MHDNLFESRPIADGDTATFAPHKWWRRLCWLAGHRIALCGDLPSSQRAKEEQLMEWQAAGVTHIIDVRGEWNDAAFVARHAPEITYISLGTHDNGGAQHATWFEAGVRAALDALADPTAKIVVHCHMGVNRGPSMGFAILLALGLEPEEALNLIRAARPIAAVIYAEDAIRWWTSSGNAGSTTSLAARRVVQRWHQEHPVDLRWIISRIRQAEAIS
jgi:dual specificity phosphatase 3